MCEMLMPLNIGESSSLVWSGMKPMLCAVLRPRFSKTARSGPAHREAARHGEMLPATPVLRRRDVDDVPERSAECAEAGEADVETDVGDAALGLAEQEHRPL